MNIEELVEQIIPENFEQYTLKQLRERAEEILSKELGLDVGAIRPGDFLMLPRRPGLLFRLGQEQQRHATQSPVVRPTRFLCGCGSTLYTDKELAERQCERCTAEGWSVSENVR